MEDKKYSLTTDCEKVRNSKTKANLYFTNTIEKINLLNFIMAINFPNVLSAENVTEHAQCLFSTCLTVLDKS